MKKLTILTAMLLCGCATNVTPQPIGGSKSDGTVTVSFEYGMFQKPIVNWETANRSAIERCMAWGYNDAEAFSGAQNTCLAYNGYGNCVRTQVNVTYQCTD